MAKIVIFTASVNIGGIERVMLTYASGLAKKGHSVHYVTCAGKGDFEETLPAGVQFVDLGTARLRKSIFALAKFLGKEHPDIILTANDTTLIVYLSKLLSGSDAKLISSQHNYYDNVEAKSFRHNFIIKYVYPRCNKIIAVSRGIASMLVDNFKIPTCKIKTIYNPIDVDYISRYSAEPVNVPSEYILFVGRLSVVKNLYLLMDAFHHFSQNHPHVQLIIIGDGAMREELQNYAEDKYPLSGISFLGTKPNPYPYIAHARIVSISSSSEALPTVLLESMSLGRTCVSTPTIGAIDILKGGEYGYISDSLDNVNSYVEELEKAYNSPKDLEMLQRIIARQYGLDEKIAELERLWE